MITVPQKPLPLIRLAIYLLIVGVCGAVACRELYYALACESTTATVIAVGKTGRPGSRTSGFWAQYEYFDDPGERHLGRAESFNFSLDATISPTVFPGDTLDIQFLRHAPQTSRITPSVIGGICFAAVAFLAGFVFAAELVVPWQRRRRARGHRLTWLAVLGLAAIIGAMASGQEERRPKDFTNSIGMKFVWIAPGHFMMGSPATETGRGDDEIAHKVTLGGFYLGVHTVTQEKWQTVMGNNPSELTGDKNLPVDSVSWQDALAFVRKLETRDKKRYRLPTEAEWEYACRAGTTTPFHFGETLSAAQANYNGNFTYGNGKPGISREKTVPVGALPPNAWGLHEMHGNLWQWCQDWHGGYQAGQVIDPQGPKTGKNRILRGGSWGSHPVFCRSANRNFSAPDARTEFYGFRVCFSPPR
jgi:formylglycine-generating enzyme required for sulfatase activity